MRWKLDGDDPQGALFAGVERHQGRGEYRGMEFLHVSARSIINTLPKSGFLPFRHTINAYRGCSHACTYCLEGSTAVLLATGRTKAIADLAVGDDIMGTAVVAGRRCLVPTRVLDHWSTVKPGYRVLLDDGNILVASAGHRFLTDVGWRTVADPRRASLQDGSRLVGVGTGAVAESPKGGQAYQQGYLHGMVRGDGPARRPRGAGGAEPVQRARRYFAELDPSTDIGTQWPAQPCEECDRGFLAGAYDDRGHLGNGDPVVHERIGSSLRRSGFDVADEGGSFRLVGGVAALLRFVQLVDPAHPVGNLTGVALDTDGEARVASVQPVGSDLPLYDITTGTGDFIANGVVSHNCFARPTHDYLELDISEGFERQIVVKVNAVDRLRAELDPRRWSGEPIAMGTNTDPYQRCEGKYRLTRGLVEVLSTARNPFSILTKSTLVLRDLDLLAEAAGRTDVAVNLSIGTLDEGVWRATEPGTPHPRQRMEAVAKLNAAGVTCGVLVAPVLPGLSDQPEQLDEVVAAAVAAGAASVSGGMAVYLKPGVREVFLDHLGRTHPDLVALYESVYTGTYAPRAVKERISGHLHDAMAHHRPRAVAAPRRRTAPVPPAAAPSDEQLHLGM